MGNKERNILLVMFILLSGYLSGQDMKDIWPVLKGPYLGQKPPGKTPILFAPGIISTKKRELNSVFSPKGDEFYYSHFSPEPVNKCTIMVTRKVNGIWTEPKTASFSGGFIDVDMALNPEGNKLYFCSIRPDKSGFATTSKHDIWVCIRRIDKSWSEPLKLDQLINSKESETYPTFTRNGRMYFTAIRDEGLGGKDIYYSNLVNGKFSKPINIGKPVNTRFDEGDTFVSPDQNYLIVSSVGRDDEFGGSDLYISFRKDDDSWTTPINMGEPINTEMYEYSPMVSPDGKYLFFSRFSEGIADIYWVEAIIIEEIKSRLL